MCGIDVSFPWKRLKVNDAFKEYAKIEYEDFEERFLQKETDAGREDGKEHECHGLRGRDRRRFEKSSC